MSKKLKLYIAFIIAVSFVVFIITFKDAKNIDVTGTLFFIVLAVIAETMLIQVPNTSAISVSFAIAYASIMVFGLPVAAWISCLGTMFRVPSRNGKREHIFNTPIYKTLFNGGNLFLSSTAAGMCYIYAGGKVGVFDIKISLLPAVVSFIVYIFVNEMFLTILQSIIHKESFSRSFYKGTSWLIKNYLVVAPLGIILAFAYIKYSILGVLLFFAPLLLARYSFKLYVNMRSNYVETVKALSQAIEAKDPYTQGHSMRVSQYACDLAEKIELPLWRVENLRIAAILHDIGKIGVEENILNKPGKLTSDEFDKIKMHPEIGVKILKEIDFLSEVSGIILSHHEHFDGRGYPNGKKGKEIPIESSILCIADVFDALTSDRPYRRAMSLTEAFRVLEEGKNTQFDERLVNAFLKMVNEKREMG